MPAAPLTEWLRGQDDRQLADLLRARPDLAAPPPADVAVLAARAGSRASVTRAAEGLDTFTLAVLDALVVADADRAPVPLDEVAALVGPEVPASRVRAAVDRLVGLALAWGEPESLSVAPAAREAGGLYPAGLGQPSPALDGVDIAAVLAELPDADRRLLGTLAHGSPVGRTRDAAVVVPLERAETPVQRLLARGLLLRRDAETVELPRQVGLVLRGESPLGTVRLDEPPMQLRQHSTVDATGAGEALELLRRAEKLVELWSVEPAAVLKAGGLGVRDVRRLARELDTDDRGAALLAELLFGAGLVADSATATSPEWMPTSAVDPWLVATPQHQWATLAAAWLDLPRLPGLAGMRDAKDKVLAPLSDDLRRPPAPAERRRVLGALADLPSGTGVASPDELADVLAWRAPRRGGRLRDEIVRWTLAEATALGLVALGAITAAGRALLADGPAQAAKAMAESMPEPIDHVLVQADLTVVAPGPLEPTLAVDVGLVADVESAGSATVYRVTEASVRRALDAGRTAEDLHELFRTRSRTPVPQGLSYLIDDVARRHGRLRGGVAASFLRCDDPVLLAEVAAHPTAASLELRRIAPTVLVSPLPLADVLEDLRKAGFAPAAEGADGQVVDLRPKGHRLPATARTRRVGTPNPPSDERLRDIVAQLRAGDTAAATRRGRTVSLAAGGGAADTAATLALLREAIEQQGHVLIDFVDSRGVATQRVVTPFRVGGGVLEGRDDTNDTVRQYPLHRITSASLISRS
ncbi:helicase-associated domain-containing protein [Actinophytocola gossypii]|uniref:Helicase-associated domain-containing protein n=1 Tax=Actinophytocola gossypii TaxID=2812003 RepID=A0ABT2J4U5_9PSEU|nr:helicase-associated domain-containing protein [Actinophytocola gossypii]MCT2582701.1 helicase-associated domain-containing protein [Actinophytocola gossypii]